jgi:lysophospholipase L1-like esterase
VKYELTPGASGRAWGADVTINSHGFRGPEPRPGRFSGHRIIVLGDSITFGNFLPIESTFASQLQQLLRAEAHDFEVLNFGVGGYDTLQEVALLEARGRFYHPDLIIVGYCLNDIGIVSHNLEYIERVQARQAQFWFRSRLVQFVHHRLDKYTLQNWSTSQNSLAVFRQEYARQIDPIREEETDLLTLMERAPQEYPSEWYKSRERVGRLRFAFRRLQHLSAADGLPVLVVIIPWLTDTAAGYPHSLAHRIVELEARRAGFATIDLTEAFMQAGVEHLRIDPQDPMHPNQTGHTIIAQALSTYIRTHAKQVIWDKDLTAVENAQ